MPRSSKPFCKGHFQSLLHLLLKKRRKIKYTLQTGTLISVKVSQSIVCLVCLFRKSYRVVCLDSVWDSFLDTFSTLQNPGQSRTLKTDRLHKTGRKIRSYQLTHAGKLTLGWEVGRYGLAGISYILCERIFISCFSEC